MKLSRGMITTEKQANVVLLIIVIGVILIAFYLLKGHPAPLATEQEQTAYLQLMSSQGASTPLNK